MGIGRHLKGDYECIGQISESVILKVPEPKFEIFEFRPNFRPAENFRNFRNWYTTLKNCQSNATRTLCLRLTNSEKSCLKENFHWLSYNMGFDKKNKNDVTAFGRFRIFEKFSFSELFRNIPRRMALEPCLYDLSSLRKLGKKNNMETDTHVLTH